MPRNLAGGIPLGQASNHDVNQPKTLLDVPLVSSREATETESAGPLFIDQLQDPNGLTALAHNGKAERVPCARSSLLVYLRAEAGICVAILEPQDLVVREGVSRKAMRVCDCQDLASPLGRKDCPEDSLSGVVDPDGRVLCAHGAPHAEQEVAQELPELDPLPGDALLHRCHVVRQGPGEQHREKLPLVLVDLQVQPELASVPGEQQDVLSHVQVALAPVLEALAYAGKLRGPQEEPRLQDFRLLCEAPCAVLRNDLQGASDDQLQDLRGRCVRQPLAPGQRAPLRAPLGV
mmetsp:Transcript_107653/g.347455  ORF Transcript_107653/g.347455 Transcript_107653/m.347455 type:complete len:291 (-) Transcript_107653:1225-2097(-)